MPSDKYDCGMLVHDRRTDEVLTPSKRMVFVDSDDSDQEYQKVSSDF